MSKVKSEHGRLEHTLEYLKSQQGEFEGLMEQLENSLPPNMGLGGGSLGGVEPERETLYALAESVDTELQGMAEDLKDIIRHINEANRSIDQQDPVSHYIV